MGRMHSTSSTLRRHQAWHRTLWLMLVGVVAAMLVECVVFNMPFWRSLAASTDSDTAVTTTGAGLARGSDGAVSVTNPTSAYFVVHQDGSSPYLHVDTVPPRSQPWDGTYGTVHLRVEPLGQGCGSSSVSVSPQAPRSLWLTVPHCDASSVRVWVEEPAGSATLLTNIRANVQVPFSWDWVRVLVMILAWLLLVIWLPGSPLWLIPLNTRSVRQRWCFAVVVTLVGGYALVRAGVSIATASRLVFHEPGRYTFDLDQYGHVADALFHGRVWLDLPVPDQLLQVSNPYDVQTRLDLMKDGASPIYWDYAFRDGHWYSYFGVVPAILLFLPYQAITSLWVPGGLMLPSAAAEPIFMALATIFGVLLSIRIVQRVSHHISVAAVSLLATAFVLGSDMLYLWYRVNFYSIPFAAAMALTLIGLWVWMGAAIPATTIAHTGVIGHAASSGTCKSRFGLWQVPGADAVSLPRVAIGSACIGATMGCRPTFATAAILGFAIFWPQLRALWRIRTHAHHDVHGGRLVVRLLIAVCVPALVVVAPVLAYNHARFGSWLDFGNAYQFTVADMTSFHTPWVNMPLTMLYYLGLPLRFESTFPFLALSPTPLPLWSFTEPSIGGIVWLMPLMVLALAVPFMRRQLRGSGLLGLCNTALVLGALLLVFDSYVGGFSWRYMADFCWLFMLGAVTVGAWWVTRRGAFGRWVVAVSVLAALVLAVMSCFALGRDDMLIVNDPATFHAVQSWFTLL
ncbi:glycosyltransferase [Bifidobacterium gallicum DSM 20093 = LMG 11596]|uniref:Glycosyltransferase n=2 Tax=Bifidobacterium gallicum TaxID=78342 RepID=A0A087AJD2_9BIFI|nr:glycosyltransferase [Bifidobacterium gallicum DSM 20093 = LMG 11596]